MEDVVFSGKRLRRGVYRNKDGTLLNADLNGSANILRKAFPDAFQKGAMPDFSKVTVKKHPEYDAVIQNRQQQKRNSVPSKSKLKRNAKKSNPYGIGLCE